MQVYFNNTKKIIAWFISRHLFHVRLEKISTAVDKGIVSSTTEFQI